MGNTLVAKYSELGSLVVKVQINGISLSNTFIDLGSAINLMAKYTMERLGLTNLRQNTIISQLVDQSLIRLGGVIEDVFILVDSWDYPVDFMVLQKKLNLGGYPLVHVRPWLDTTDSYIGCWSKNKHLSLVILLRNSHGIL